MKWKSFLDGDDVYREIWSVISLIVWLENKGAQINFLKRIIKLK